MSAAHNAADDYPVHRVPMTRPFVWIARGWDDLLHHRMASLAYGLLVASLGALILGYQRHPYFLAVATSGFLLVGPIITAGVCELSRAQDHGEPTGFDESLGALSRNRVSLIRFAEILCAAGIAWFFMSFIMLTGMIGEAAPTVQSTVWGDVLRQLSPVQRVAYLATGGGLACIVLILSVVTVPMIIEHHVSASTAIQLSLRVAEKDWPAMLVWGALITLLVIAGFATYLVGMVVIFPLLGHATWYAYRDLVE